MLHCIQSSTNTCEVTMQVKRAIGKAILHKLSIYNEYMCLCWVSILFCVICCLFSNCSRSSTTRLRSLFITLRCERSHVPVLLAMQWSVAASRSAFYRGREHLWIVFSFKLSSGNQGQSHLNNGETKFCISCQLFRLDIQNFNQIFVIRTNWKSLSNNAGFNLSQKKDKLSLCKISR